MNERDTPGIENKPANVGNLSRFLQERTAQKHVLKKKYGDRYAQVGRTFTLTVAEEKVVQDWFESLRPEILAKQQSKDDIMGSPDEPYYGAIGGGLKYTFLPTALGNILVVTETVTGKSLNVTEALDWFFFG